MKAAILGGGQIGQRHAHNFTRLGYGVMVYDPVPHRSTGQSVSEILDGADLAVIATPPLQRLDAILDALLAGVKWLLIEKPLATTAHDARTLGEIIRAYNAQAFVGYCLRFALSTIQLPEAIKTIEPIESLEAIYSGPAPFYVQPWLRDPIQGGIVLEHSHILDLLLHTFGTPDHVVGVKELDRVRGHLAWSRGITSTLVMEFAEQKTMLRMVGRRGVITWHREWLEAPGVELARENPTAWLLHEAQEFHAMRIGGEHNHRLCTLDEAIAVLDFAERL